MSRKVKHIVDPTEISLEELVMAGIITPQTKFVASYKGNDVEGHVTAKGKFKIRGGETFNSLSTAARSVQRDFGNTNPNVNGWAFWNVKKGRETVKAADLRKMA